MPIKIKVKPWWLFIKSELELGEKYTHQMWKDYKMHVEKYGYHPPSSQSFNKYIYYLTDIGLIRKSKKEPKPGVGFDRQYYSLVMENIDDPAWDNPVIVWNHKHGNSL